ANLLNRDTMFSRKAVPPGGHGWAVVVSCARGQGSVVFTGKAPFLREAQGFENLGRPRPGASFVSVTVPCPHSPQKPCAHRCGRPESAGQSPGVLRSRIGG